MVKAVCVIAGDVKGNIYFEQVKIATGKKIKIEKKNLLFYRLLRLTFCIYQRRALVHFVVADDQHKMTSHFILMEYSRTNFVRVSALYDSNN